MIDPLFGKYCYIDTPWIAGEKTIYKIVRSGVRSNGWREVPVKGRGEVVVHDWSEDVVYVVLDTLIDETSKIEKFALKDIKLIDEPKHGEWIETGRTNVYGGTELQCPFCGDRVMVQHIEDELFCRHCGADMRGKDHE